MINYKVSMERIKYEWICPEIIGIYLPEQEKSQKKKTNSATLRT